MLEVLLSLLVVVILIMFFLRITERVSGVSEQDNRDRLNEILSRITLLSQSTDKEIATQQMPIRLGTQEFFMFFSVGNSPIILQSVLADDFNELSTEHFEPYSPSNDYDPRNHLIFERPAVSECNNQACVCHCKTGELWSSIEDVPYLTLDAIESQTSIREEGFYCKDVSCKSLPEPNALFTNSRGNKKDDLFFDSFIQERQKKQYEFISIPLDVVSLLSLNLQRNLFFDTEDAEGFIEGRLSYSEVSQNSLLFEPLLKYLRWNGGVVLGGSGAALSKSDSRNHKLRPVSSTINIVRYNNTSVYGVCLFDECLYEHQAQYVQKKQSYDDAILELKERFYSLERFFEEDFKECINNAQQQNDIFDKEIDSDLCFVTLQEELIFFFDNELFLKNNIDPALRFKKITYYGEQIPEISLVVNPFGAEQNDGSRSSMRTITVDAFNVTAISYPHIIINDNEQILTNNAEIQVSSGDAQFSDLELTNTGVQPSTISSLFFEATTSSQTAGEEKLTLLISSSQ